MSELSSPLPNSFHYYGELPKSSQESTIYVVQAGNDVYHVMDRGKGSERVQYDETGRIIKIGDKIIPHVMVEAN